MTVLSGYLEQIKVSESTSDFSIVDDIASIISPPSPTKAENANKLAHRQHSPLSIPIQLFPPIQSVQDILRDSQISFGQLSELRIEKLRTRHRLKVVQVMFSPC